jgi:AcrR family transcriptional regulator
LGRPKTPRISKDNTILVALEIIDEQGLEAFSLERVAKRMGVRAPSLYHHFHNKAELLTEVARSILRKIEVPTDTEADWEEQFLALCLATRRAILQHPRAGLLLLQYFPRTLLLSAYDLWASKCPYPSEVQMLILDGAEKINFGSSFFAAAATAYTTPVMPKFSATKFPTLAAAVNSNPHNDEQLFAQTIRVFLAGLKALYGVSATAKPAVEVTPKKASSTKASSIKASSTRTAAKKIAPTKTAAPKKRAVRSS